jgi:DNA invertase Pin-like site-specific DNA recombinase
MNAVIYCRVSSKEQVDGTSLESQELACREYAAKNRITVQKVFIERGESAKFADRTQLLELLAFCRDKSQRVDCLLVWKVDRLARNVGDHFSIKASLLKQNVRVISVTEPIDAKPEGKLLETILAGFAQFDNDVRAARSVQGMRRKLQEGLFPWKAPLGYRSVTVGKKKTEPDEPDQPIFGLLQRAWNEFATGHFKKVELLHRITENGVRTRAGKPLSKQNLDYLLTDPFYAGVIRDPWSGEEFPGRHLPMISRTTFAKVQQLLRGSTRAVPHQSVRDEFPLRVFVRCANCETHLTGGLSRGRSNTYPYYRCFNKNCDCNGNYPQQAVHTEFLSFLASVSPSRAAVSRLKHCLSKAAHAWIGDSDTLREKRMLERKRMAEQQQQLIRMKMEQLISNEEFMAQRTVLTSRMQELDGQEVENPTDPDSVLHDLEEICAQLMDLGSAWRDVPSEMKRRFQLLALPSGFVVGRVATAQRGRLFEVLTQLSTSKTSLVPPTGLSWNQLAEEVEAFAALFRESLANPKK